MTGKRKHPLILTSKLTAEPRYYVSRAYKTRPNHGETYVSVEITGQKFDITDQIEAIVKERCNERA